MGSILLIIVLIILVITAFYQWNTNSKIDFSIRTPDDPVFKTEKYPISSIKKGEVPDTTKATTTNPHANNAIEPGAMSILPSDKLNPLPPKEEIPDAEEIPLTPQEP